MAKRSRPLVAFVNMDELWSLYSRLERKAMTSHEVAEELERLAHRRGCEKPFAKVPLGIPTGHRQLCMCYLRVWLKLRSETCPEYIRRQGGEFKPLMEFRAATVDRCKQYIAAMEREYRSAPVIGSAWTKYLLEGVDLLKEDPRVEVARRENAARYGGFDWNR